MTGQLHLFDGPAAGAPGVQGPAVPAGVQGQSPATLDPIATTVSSWNDSLTEHLTPLRAVRAAALASVGGPWHVARAEALGRTVAERIADCGRRRITLQNDMTGEVIERPIWCRQRTCPECAQRASKKLRRRMRQVLTYITAEEQREKRTPVMLTFTVRHSGDVRADVQALSKAWARWRASWAAYAAGRGFARKGFAYLRTLEVTAGTRKDGHAHWHVLAWLPQWCPYKAMHRWWRKALRHESGREADESPGYLRVDRVKSASRAMVYVSKVAQYVSKGLTGLEAMTPQVGAQVVDGLYGRRWFVTSAGFLAPREPDTSFDVWQVVQLPDPTPSRRRWWTLYVAGAT